MVRSLNYFKMYLNRQVDIPLEIRVHIWIYVLRIYGKCPFDIFHWCHKMGYFSMGSHVVRTFIIPYLIEEKKKSIFHKSPMKNEHKKVYRCVESLRRKNQEKDIIFLWKTDILYQCTQMDWDNIFVSAIQSQDIVLVKEWIDNGFSITTRDNIMNEDILTLACKTGNINLVRYICSIPDYKRYFDTGYALYMIKLLGIYELEYYIEELGWKLPEKYQIILDEL